MKTSSPLTPFQNGLIKRAWGFVKEQMKAIALSDKPREQDKKVPTIRWTYNNLPHGTLGVSPYHLTFGHPGRTKLAELRAEFLAGVENAVDPKLTKSDAKYLEDLKADLKRVQDVAYVARVDQVGVICDKFELVRLLSVQRRFIAS